MNNYNPLDVEQELNDMETRKHIAAEKKRCNSHNCAQAILHTYADIAGISEDEAMSIAGAFGGGMGNMEGTCGAFLQKHSLKCLAVAGRLPFRIGCADIYSQKNRFARVLKVLN